MDSFGKIDDALRKEEDALITQIARSGVPLHTWPDKLGPLVDRRMVECLEAFRIRTQHPGGDDYHTKVQELRSYLQNFDNAPFTLQRICELILHPEAHYKSLDALLRGYEILVSVTSTIPVVPPDEIVRLEQEYNRVISTAVPGANSGMALRRTDTVEMDTGESVEMEVE